MTRNVIAINMILVILHAVTVLVHAVAHVVLAVNLSVLDDVFIVAVIMIAPIAAGMLLRTKRRRLGAVMLGLSMLGACIYGVYNHLVAQGIDNIAQVSTGGWGTIFRLTAILLAIIEGLGTVAALWAFGVWRREDRRQR